MWLCWYNILVKGTITITGAGDDAAVRQADERDKGIIFKNRAPFTKCISRMVQILIMLKILML